MGSILGPKTSTCHRYGQKKKKEVYKSLQIINAGKAVEKKEPPPPTHDVGGNVNWYSHYGEQYGVSSKKLKNRVTI